MTAMTNFFQNIYEMTETLIKFACHHLQNEFYHENNSRTMVEVSLLYLDPPLILILLLVFLHASLNQSYV